MALQTRREIWCPYAPLDALDEILTAIQRAAQLLKGLFHDVSHVESMDWYLKNIGYCLSDRRILVRDHCFRHVAAHGNQEAVEQPLEGFYLLIPQQTGAKTN